MVRAQVEPSEPVQEGVPDESGEVEQPVEELPEEEVAEDAEETAPDQEPSLIEQFLDEISGDVRTRYRLQATFDETDQDLWQVLRFDIGDPDQRDVTFSFLGDWDWDLDERRRNSAFASSADSYDRHANARLLRAHVTFHRLGTIERARLGRQDGAFLPEVPVFDGALVESEAWTDWKLSARAYAGVPTHLYESSPSGDWLYGGGVEIEPGEATWAGFHYVRLRDRFLQTTNEDGLFVLEGRHRPIDALQLSARSTAVEGNFRDLQVRANTWLESLGLHLDVSYFTLLRTQRALVTEVDPYFLILREERPYDEWRALISQDIGDHVTIEAGFWIRTLREPTDEGVFNREFRRYFLSPRFYGWPDEGTSFSLTGELWNTDDEQIQSLGFDLSQELNEDLEVSFGSEYALYEFDPLFGGEREQVRTFYLRGDWDASDSVRLDLSLEHERDDRDSYRTLRIGCLWRF